MNPIDLKFYTPVATGAPAVGNVPARERQTAEASFAQTLSQEVARQSEVGFSKHALKRAQDHGLDLSPDSLQRLDRGVRLAGERSLSNPLILVGGAAFIVNVKNNTVITALDGSAGGSVITDIDGTVIV